MSQKPSPRKSGQDLRARAGVRALLYCVAKVHGFTSTACACKDDDHNTDNDTAVQQQQAKHKVGAHRSGSVVPNMKWNAHIRLHRAAGVRFVVAVALVCRHRAVAAVPVVSAWDFMNERTTERLKA